VNPFGHRGVEPRELAECLADDLELPLHGRARHRVLEVSVEVEALVNSAIRAAACCMS
jgi:hypothetical protein